MTYDADDEGASRDVALAYGLGAGALFCAIWSGLTAAFNLWADLSPFIVAVLSSGAAAGTAAYKLGASAERVGLCVVSALFGAVFLGFMLAEMTNPLGRVLETIARKRIAFSAVDIVVGAAIATVFGKKWRHGENR